MKALTLYQPWATLISISEKKIETRSWPTRYRGPLAIHASQERKYIDMRSKYYVCDKEPFDSVIINYFNSPDLSFIDAYFPFPRGDIIAICELETVFPIHEGPLLISDQEKAFGDYTLGRFMWFLENVRKLKEPISAKGALGLWNWTPPGDLEFK